MTWGGTQQDGPLHYDRFTKLNTLQMHAPLDKKQVERLKNLSRNDPEGRVEGQRATRARQLANVLIGVAVGCVAFFLRLCYEPIAHIRMQTVLSVLGTTGSWQAVLAATVVSCAFTAVLALTASLFVVWRPAANSSGIVAVIAYLNGVDLNQELGPGVLAAKVCGTILAVASGLAVGPEGPMIHIGAMVGRLTVQSVVLPFLRNFTWSADLEQELQMEPMRLDVQAAAMGAGAGIAAAFSAPIAGTLFVVEEAASFFSHRLFFHTFITCSAAYITIKGFEHFWWGSHVVSFYAKTPMCEGNMQWSATLMAEVVGVGILCGFMGLAFNRYVVKICKASAQEAYNLGQGWQLLSRRLLWVLAMGTLCGCFSVWFVALRPCVDASLQNVFENSSGCIPEDWWTQIASTAKSLPSLQMSQAGHLQQVPDEPLVMAFNPWPGLFGAQYNPSLCPQALNITKGTCSIPGIAKHLDPKTGLKKEHYCCGFNNIEALRRGDTFSFERPKAPLNMSSAAWPKSICGEGYWDEENHVWIQGYSPAAALAFTKPAQTVRNLLMRGAPYIMPMGDLATFLVCYGILTALCTGALVPGGLLVPMMIIGATTGRLASVLVDFLLRSMPAARYRPPILWIPQLTPLLEVLYPQTTQRTVGLPPEPGVLAAAGCAAFLSGSGGIALFVIVLLVEITLAPHLIPAVIVAVLAARGTASLLKSKGLYHELVNVQSLPFLAEQLHWRQENYVVTDILKQDVETVQSGHGGGQVPVGGASSSLGSSIPGAGVGAGSVTRPRDLAGQGGGAAAEGIPTGIGTVEEGLASEDVLGLPAAEDIWGRTCSVSSVMEHFEAFREIMVTVRRDATRQQVRRLLDDNPTVNGIPVVEEDGQLCGLATRAALEKQIARTESYSRQSSPPSVDAGPSSQPLTSMESPGSRLPLGVDRVMDCAPFVVPATTRLKHAHMLFYRCGLRHLVVVDRDHRPLGLLTRKSLMPWRIPMVPGVKDTFLQPRMSHEAINSPPGSLRVG